MSGSNPYAVQRSRMVYLGLNATQDTYIYTVDVVRKDAGYDACECKGSDDRRVSFILRRPAVCGPAARKYNLGGNGAPDTSDVPEATKTSSKPTSQAFSSC
jgi:hypothetical protein